MAIEISSMTRRSVVFQFFLARPFFTIREYNVSTSSLPRPIPAQEWSVFALLPIRSAAQPVMAQS